MSGKRPAPHDQREPDDSKIRPKRARLPQRNIPLPAWKDFEMKLKNSVKMALPTTDKRYGYGTVLSVDFANTDFDVRRERERFLGIMKNTFNFSVERYTIDTNLTGPSGPINPRQATLKLRKRLTDWTSQHMRDEDPRGLMVLYISCHGLQSVKDPRQLILCGTQRQVQGSPGQEPYLVPQEPYIIWDNVKLPLISFGDWTKSDVLCIFDCCQAALANLSNSMEFLGATTWESWASEAPQTSFTRYLCEAIEYFHGRPFTAAQLHERMTHGGSNSRLRQSMPVHFFCGYPPKSSVLIHQIQTPLTEGSVEAAQELGVCRVLITVHIEDETSVPPVSEWQNWLLRMPQGIRDVEVSIKGLANTGSALVFVEIPSALWLYLEDHSALTYVDMYFPKPVLRIQQPRRQLQLENRPITGYGTSQKQERSEDIDEPGLGERSQSQLNIRR